MHDDELESMQRELATICRETFPELRPQQVTGLAQISDGWECDVYRFDLRGTDAGKSVRHELILRMYLGRGAGRKAAWEFRVLRELDRAGYPVPRVDAVVATDSSLGAPFTLMERVSGTTLGEVMLSSNDTSARENYLNLFCRLLAELHLLDWRPFVDQPDEYAAETAIRSRIAKMSQWPKSLDVQEFDEAFEWLDARASAIQPGRLAVVHWDFHPWNVLMRPGGQPSVIDWTSAEVTDSRFDLAWTLLLVSTGRHPSVRDAVLTEYVRLSGGPVADLGFFEAAASLRRIFSMVVSMSHGSEVFGMRPGAEAQIQRSLAHLRAVYQLFQARTGLRIPIVEHVLTDESGLSAQA